MVLVPEVVACDSGFVTLVDMILPGRGLLGNRSHAWLDTVASFGLEYERALGPAGHLKDEAGWLGVNRLRGLRRQIRYRGRMALGLGATSYGLTGYELLFFNTYHQMYVYNT